jgi:hypothetical protein
VSFKKSISTYRDLRDRLSQLSDEQLDQPVQLVNDYERWEPYCVYIAEQDFFDFKEREHGDPCLPASELSGSETDVFVGIAKGAVTIICDL